MQYSAFKIGKVKGLFIPFILKESKSEIVKSILTPTYWVSSLAYRSFSSEISKIILADKLGNFRQAEHPSKKSL
jgi:hypothetical protein